VSAGGDLHGAVDVSSVEAADSRFVCGYFQL